jgi:diguanylate cyclase (GGDEF)-like protein
MRLLLLESREEGRPTFTDFNQAGVQITRTCQLAETLLMIEERQFELLMLDAAAVSGPLIDNLRAIHARRPNLAVVVLVDADEEYLCVELLRLGFEDFVIKGTLDDAMLMRWAERSFRQQLLAQELEQARSEARRSALQDPVTGLANRPSFHDSLEQTLSVAKRYEQSAAVLYADLDSFKAVNSAHGHAVGDGLLRIVGERMRASVRESDLVARLGGDDFTVLLRNIRHPEDAGPVASCILSELCKPVCFVDSEIAVTASAGIAIYPYDGATARELIQAAELAMYTAKGAGRNTYQFHSQGAEPRLRLVHNSDVLNF